MRLRSEILKKPFFCLLIYRDILFWSLNVWLLATILEDFLQDQKQFLLDKLICEIVTLEPPWGFALFVNCVKICEEKTHPIIVDKKRRAEDLAQIKIYLKNGMYFCQTLGGRST